MKIISWKSWTVCGVLLWVLLVISIFLYGRMTSTTENQVPSPPVLNSDNTLLDEPYVGEPVGNKPEEVIRLFVANLDAGELEQAVSFLEPNYLVSQSKDLKNDFYQLVRLWEKGELQKYIIDIPSINYSPLPCRIIVTLTNGTKKIFLFELVELVNVESNPPAKVWYIQNIRLESM
ncbi:hypothetical protein [Paenibacillus sp. GYB003]|uniref:hypothetical protein n=1 Tax=Paenibacillus sp. GYB003 TaxID=2994392 RepID=UPI002F96720F